MAIKLDGASLPLTLRDWYPPNSIPDCSVVLAMRSSQSHFRPQCIHSVESMLRPGRSRSRLHSKYANVRASIDSGLNMLKVNEKFPELKVNARFKKEEFFRHMKPATLVRLLNESTGNLFAEKGINNIFMLNGGIREMAMRYPDMIEGHLKTQTPYFTGTSTPSLKSEPYTSSGYASTRRWRRPSSVSYLSK